MNDQLPGGSQVDQDEALLRKALLFLWEHSYHEGNCPAYSRLLNSENLPCSCGWADLMAEREKRGIE